MQTRRDQLQAYRFQNRRALAALVAGEPNLLDPPMRRLTVTTIAGVMIAVLVTVGFTIYGLIRPKAGDSWKAAGSIIVEKETGATYVYIDDTLYSVVNYTSGVLALAAKKPTTTVEVGRDDIEGAKRGAQIGIPNLPGTLPSADSLVDSGFATCSRQQVVSTNQVGVRVSVHMGDELATRPVRSGDAVLVATADAQQYLLYNGRRLAVAPGQTITALGLAATRPLRVGTAFINTVPQGANLRAPSIPGQGNPAPLRGISARIGQLITTPGGRTFVAMPDGVAPVNSVQRALLETLPIGPGGSLVDPVNASQSSVLEQPSRQWDDIVATQLAGLPDTVPTIAAAAGDNGAVCARFAVGSARPTFAVPPSTLPSYPATSITESDTSRRGVADSVVLPPGRAALLRSLGDDPTIYLAGDSGQKFAVTDDELLGGFGYSADDAVRLPAAVVKLIASGPALDPAQARHSIGN